MNIDINPLYAPVFTTQARYIMLWGGRSRGASHFATDYFLWQLTRPKYFRGAMLRATMAQITQSLWIALNKRIKTAVDAGYIHINDLKINGSSHTVTYKPNGNQIICKGFRKTTTAAGADLKGLEGITHAIVEEAEDVYEADFNELDSTFRTTEVKNIQIFVLFNPPSKNHWLMTNHFDLVSLKKCPGWYKAIQKPDFPELLSIHSTYMDNLINVNEGTKRLYRNFGDPQHPKYNPDYYHRSVLGLVSEGRKGRIFTNVKRIRRELYDQLPYAEFLGLDFGSTSPTALTGNKFHNGKLYSRQIIYREGLTVGELVAEMKRCKVSSDIKIYADPAEPNSIKAMQKYGFNVLPALKGADSIEYGYRELLSVSWYITDDSTSFWKEAEEHIWELDAEKNPTDTPEDANNHAIDATRYAYTMHVARKGGKAGINTETGEESKGGRRLIDSLDDPVYQEMQDMSRGINSDDIESLYSILYPD